MQGKILALNLILSLVIFKVMTQEVDKESDDAEFDNYKANLINAVETLSKNLNTRDARNLQKRDWLKNLWDNFLKPFLTSSALKLVAGALFGKRSFDDNEAWKPEVRELNGTQCFKDVVQFQEVKKAASQLCALTKIPDVKCR